MCTPVTNSTFYAKHLDKGTGIPPKSPHKNSKNDQKEFGELLTGRALEDEFLAIAQSLDGDLASRVNANRYLSQTHALKPLGGPCAWSMSPKIFDKKGIERLAWAAETMATIMDKVTARYLEDSPNGARLRARFALGQPLEDYARIDCGYRQLIPLARVDIFFNEETGDFQFCELNTDGSAGMTATVEVTRAIQTTRTYHKFLERHPSITTFDIIGTCAATILQTYDEWCNNNSACKASPPSLAITDFTDRVSMHEVHDFIDYFHTQGIHARFTDLRDMRCVRQGTTLRLVDCVGPIDLVWRRVVPVDIVERPCSGVDALVRAQKMGVVCVVGGFCTWIAATKTMFAVLWDDELMSDLLTEEERAFVHEHVPYTVRLSPESNLKQFMEKDRWICKPSDGFNGKEVVAGLDVSDAAWHDVLASTAKHRGVVQTYAPQYATPILPGNIESSTDLALTFDSAINMEGLYLFNGAFSGVFTRCSYKNTISESTGRLNMGCLVVEE